MEIKTGEERLPQNSDTNFGFAKHPAPQGAPCSPVKLEGMLECPHGTYNSRVAVTSYQNQHGKGWRCEECHTKWFRRNNGEQVETCGASRWRRPGWTPRNR